MKHLTDKEILKNNDFEKNRSNKNFTFGVVATEVFEHILSYLVDFKAKSDINLINLRTINSIAYKLIRKILSKTNKLSLMLKHRNFLSSTANTSILITKENTALGMGKNQYGELGLENYSPKYYPTKITNKTFKLVGSSEYSNFFITNNEKIYSTGANDCSQFKNGITNITTKLQEIRIRGHKVTKIIVQKPHIFYVTCNRKNKIEVFTSGYNQYGELGVNSLSSFQEKITITDRTIIAIRHSRDTTFFITTDKKNNYEIYCCGRNNYFQLGLSHNTNIKVPTLLKYNDFDIDDIITSNNSSFFMTTKGVYVCGLNKKGMLGLGNNHCITIPTLLKIDGEKIKKIFAEDSFTLILTDKNNAYAMGDNTWGQLGTGDKKPKYQPTFVTKLKGKVLDIKTSKDSVFFKTKKGFYATGNNIYYKLGIKTKQNNILIPKKVIINHHKVIDVAPGKKSCNFFKTKKGYLFASGENAYGKLGVGEKYLWTPHTRVDYIFNAYDELKRIKAQLFNTKKTREGLKKAINHKDCPEYIKDFLRYNYNLETPWFEGINTLHKMLLLSNNKHKDKNLQKILGNTYNIIIEEIDLYIKNAKGIIKFLNDRIINSTKSLRGKKLII